MRPLERVKLLVDEKVHLEDAIRIIWKQTLEEEKETKNGVERNANLKGLQLHFGEPPQKKKKKQKVEPVPVSAKMLNALLLSGTDIEKAASIIEIDITDAKVLKVKYDLPKKGF